MVNDEEAYDVPDENKELLIEILSCRDLPSGSKSNHLSDPYVEINLGNSNLHQTDVIKKTLNPIYSSEDRNSYILNTPARELWTKGGIELKVKEYIRGIGKDRVLGSAMVSANKLYNAPEGKMEIPLDTSGFVTIQIRKATLGDKEDAILGKTLFKMFSNINPLKKDTKSPKKHKNLQNLNFLSIEKKILLVEIVSCRNLLVADKNGLSDPYVKVKLGGKDIHKTKPVKETLNPTFGETEDNSFVIDVSSADLFYGGGILLKVKDWDRGVSGDDDLGTVQISGEELYMCEEKEYPIVPPKGHNEDAGYITVCSSQISEGEDSRKRSFLGRLVKTPKVPKILSQRNIKARNEPSDFSLLLDIVSCQNLKAGDLLGYTQPYVIVTNGSEEIHRTSVCPNNRSPIFTASTGSLFILDIMKDDFLSSKEGLTFKVFHHDPGPLYDAVLGVAKISADDLCKGDGERTVLNLQGEVKADASSPFGTIANVMNLPDVRLSFSTITSTVNLRGEKKADALSSFGTIVIRCRPATIYDKKFLGFAEDPNVSDFLGVRKGMEIVMRTQGAKIKVPGTKYSTIESSGPDTGVKKYYIRPAADPERPVVTRWLSATEIEEEIMKPPREWIHIGSGKLGCVFVEVLGADGLPNTDAAFGKTDSFVMLVYEDAVGRTDTIDNTLNPRWIPWSRRAFAFSIDHPSSNLFVGLFGHDKIGNHDLIGRAVIQVSQLGQNTEYVLSYNLFADSFNPNDRIPRGAIKLRIRVNYSSARKIALSSLASPRNNYINMQGRKHAALVRDVVNGKFDYNEYSLSTLTMLISELLSYKNLTYYLSDGILSLVFWRGQVPLFFGFNLPLHSMIAFFMAVTLVENPTLCFAYFWFANGWLLLAIQSWRNNNPHIWKRTTPFIHILMMMALDKTAPIEKIEENFQKEEADAYEIYMKEREERAQKVALERQEEKRKLSAEHQGEVVDLDKEGKNEMSTKISFAPSLLLPYLYPLQQLLASMCYYLRIVRNVYLWDESYYAFYLVAGSLVIGTVFLILPWTFILRWLGRLIAYGIFGPHMKALDIFYFSKLLQASEEEEQKQNLKNMSKIAKRKAEWTRTQTENALKLKAIRQILFGYFIARVPVINSERFIDFPLSKSYSQTYQEPSNNTSVSHVRIGGQNLSGDLMIPELRTIKEQKDKQAEDAAKTKIKNL